MVRVTDAAALFAEQAFMFEVFDSVPPPAGIVAWWRAEGNALDSVGTNHGMLTNGVTFVDGKVGQAFALNGTDQCVVIPDAPALRVTSLTFEAWVSFDTFSGNGNNLYIFAKPLGAGASHSYVLRRNGGVLYGSVADATGQEPAVAAPFTPISGRWYHLAYVFDDAYDVHALYIDGALAASVAVTKSIAYDAQPVLLGRATVNGVPSYFLQGRIDEAAVYNRALSGAEIASIYNAGALGKKPFMAAAPSLTIFLTSPNTVLLSWPSSVKGFSLQQNTDLDTANWTPWSESVTDDGTNKFIIVNPSTENRFFRLFKP